MPTKRTPINRPPKARFSPEMLDLFAQMERVECTCLPRELTGVDHVDCPGCERWRQLHSRLHHLWPGVRPWMWPIIMNPEGAEDGFEEAEARWREIEAAYREATGSTSPGA